MIEPLAALAREGRLYPSTILYGGDPEERMEAAVRLARALLCERGPEHTPTCDCRHCRRIDAPEGAGGRFHPDVLFLLQDLATVTSADATRQILRSAQLSPFEARGQVFVIASADTLSNEAANVLLKVLEEPPDSAPRHFLLLCPSADQLLETLRSRSMSAYLGPVERPDSARVEAMGDRLGELLERYVATRSPAYLLLAAGALASKAMDEPRDQRPWSLAAAAVLAAYRGRRWPRLVARALLDLAAELLLGTDARSRGIRADRILEGLVCTHLAAALPGPRG